jgi:glutamate-5-semialdehyde dehydrogenase
MIPENELIQSLERCKFAARKLRALPTQVKNEVLLRLAIVLVQEKQNLLDANSLDLADFDRSPEAENRAFRDRLLLNESRIGLMAESLKQIAALEDPVGEIVETKTLTNGLKLRKIRSPLGVIFMIFESRPNVAIEAFSLAFKSGNVIILRGGKESTRTVTAIYALIRKTLQESRVDPDSVWGIQDSDRAISKFLLGRTADIDVVVPRGGEALIHYVMKESRIPVIKHDRGMCHVYLHEDASLKMARDIVKNSKTQRPSACNAMETLLVHRAVASQMIPAIHQDLQGSNVQWFVCPETAKILGVQKDVALAKSENWDTEYLDFKMNCKVVGSLDEAITHIEHHGSRHSESIVTSDAKVAKKFEEEVDSAAVYWNASTRFTDGFEMGLGGELGISTQKLHVRGPVGLKELTSVRWIGDGSGQIRENK